MNGKRSNSSLSRRCRRWSAAIVIAAAVVAMPRLLCADEPTTRPGLEQLNSETLSLYEQVAAGLVHVEIPRPVPVVRPNIPQPPQPQPPQPPQPPATRPAGSNPTGDAGQQPPYTSLPGPLINLVAPPGATVTIIGRSSTGGTVTLTQSKVEAVPLPPPAAATGGNPVLGERMRAGPVGSTNNTGILLDRQGHVLVPMYVDRPAAGDPPLHVAGPDGSLQTARFVGSDRLTNLTVLQINQPVGTPLQWTGDRPAKGSLVLYVAPGDGSARLGLWTGGAGEFGVVVSVDGHIDGIARFGQFLNGSSCQFIAKQLVQFGVVKRATLGILISEIQANDPIRLQMPALASRSAMQVVNVIPGSAADKAGFKIDDLVLALAGEPVTDIPSFAAAIAARTGHTDVQILRHNRVMTITADLEAK